MKISQSCCVSRGSSYGLLGIVYEVTFRVRPVAPMRVETITYTLEEFERELPNIRARGDSMFMYLFPHNRKLNVEFRSYGEGPAPKAHGWRWGVRNFSGACSSHISVIWQ